MLPYKVQPKFGNRMLNVGDDDALMKSRELILQKAGYVVRSCPSREAISVLKREPFDLVLICRSVSREEGIALAKMIHASSNTKVVRLASRMTDDDQLFDFAIDTLAGPTSFLRTLAEVVDRTSIQGAGLG